MKKNLLLAAILFNNTAQAQDRPALPCKSGDVQCAYAERVKNPVRTKSYWSTALAKPLEQRVGPAPTELLVYLGLDNIGFGISNRPYATDLPEDFAKDVQDAIAEMPPMVKALVDKKLAGIYFVKDLGGSGYADYAHGGWFSRDAGFIVLDMDVLAKQKANAWATWKENTPFKTFESFTLEAQIENVASDNRKNAIQYVLLHELGHILSIGENIHPVWDKPVNSEPNLDKYPFANLSWKILRAENRYASRFDAVFSDRSNVVYYFGAKLDASAMASVYERLGKTNFPTLYASTHPGDDFAESFASYVHTVIMKRPWEIRMTHDGKLTKTFPLCWEEARCAEKRRMLEDFLGIKSH